VAAATLTPMGSPYNPPWRKKQYKKRRITFILTAWALNVFDTVYLSRNQLRKVDVDPFFTMVETASTGSGGSSTPLIGITIKW
jgi:hypothetical protein